MTRKSTTMAIPGFDEDVYVPTRRETADRAIAAIALLWCVSFLAAMLTMTCVPALGAPAPAYKASAIEPIAAFFDGEFRVNWGGTLYHYQFTHEGGSAGRHCSSSNGKGNWTSGTWTLQSGVLRMADYDGEGRVVRYVIPLGDRPQSPNWWHTDLNHCPYVAFYKDSSRK